MKKTKNNFVVWGVLFMFLAVPFQFGCEKEAELIPQEEEQILVIEDENSSSTKGTLSDRRVKLYYDESGIRYAATTALQGALSIFNSCFGTSFYYQSRSYWTHSDDFLNIYDAHSHLEDTYPHDDFFAVGGVSGRITNIGAAGTQAGSHFVIEWDYYTNDTQRKAALLHEFTHNIPGARSNCLNGDSYRYCVLSPVGVQRGILYYCTKCHPKVQAAVNNLP